MRIIADIRPWCEPHRSGVGTYAAEIMKALVRRGAHDYALFANGNALRVPEDMPTKTARISRRFTNYPNKLLNSSLSLASHPLIETLAGPADAVFLPNFGFFATKLPYVVTVHDLSFVRYPQYFSPKQRAWHAMVRPAETLRRAATVVAVSEHTRRDVIETYAIPEERVVVATPAVDARFVPQSTEAVAAVRAKYGLGARRFFLFLGTIEPRKNVAGLVEAFEKISAFNSAPAKTAVGGALENPAYDQDMDLAIAGGCGWQSDNVMRRISSSPCRERIRLLGYFDDADKPALYAAASAFVYPSFYEGFGIPPLEAMAVGTPVVASRTSSLGEVVGDAGMLIDPRSVDQLAEAMTAVISEVRYAAMLRERGLARAKRFSWDASAAVIEKAFRS